MSTYQRAVAESLLGGMADRADTLIVGGGSAGCVLAACLSGDPARSVVLVEAGPDIPDLASAPDVVRLAFGGVAVLDQLAALDWAFEAAGSASGPTIAVPRGRLMGGSGSINGTIFLRGTPEDFASWATQVGPEWAWPQVAQAYRAIEADPVGLDADHGRNGPIPVFHWPRERWIATQSAFHEACLRAGYGTTDDHNAPDAMGVGPMPLNQRDGIRVGPASAFLTAAVRARPNLRIVPRTLVRGLVLDGRRVVGVVAESADGATARLEAGEVVLSAGAVASPQLLLLAGIGPAADLRTLGIPVVADVPGVGLGVRDHPKAWTQWRLRDDLGLRADVPWLQLSARYTATGSDLRGDMMLYPNSVVPGDDPGSLDFRIEAVNNLQLSAGRLWLRSTDPTVKPGIDLRLLAEPRDRARLADAVHRSIELGRTPPLADLLHHRVLPADDDLSSVAALDAYLERTVMTGQHISSGCRMGRADDPLAVVDGAGRVRGVEGLRVIDSSIMPDSVRANIHSTVLAMAWLIGTRMTSEVAAVAA
jgi:choline dehydrogenase